MLYLMAMMRIASHRFLLASARLLFPSLLCFVLAGSLYGQEQFTTSLASAQRLFAGGKDDEAGTALHLLIHEVEKARAPLSRKPPPDITDHHRQLLKFS